MDDATLHRYQRLLLELLRAGTEPDEIVAALRADPALASLRAYIDGLDRHALAVSVELVARWAPSTEPAAEDA